MQTKRKQKRRSHILFSFSHWCCLVVLLSNLNSRFHQCGNLKQSHRFPVAAEAASTGDDGSQSSCSSNEVGAACIGDGGNLDHNADLGVFDLFAKWVDDKSSEGQAYLDELFDPKKHSKERNVKKSSETRSLFDEIRETLFSEEQNSPPAESNSFEKSLWKGLSMLFNPNNNQDEDNGSKSKETKPWYEQLANTIESISQDIKREMDKHSDAKHGEAGKHPTEEEDIAAFDFVQFFQSITSVILNKDQRTDEESKTLAAEFIEKATELSRYVQSGKSSRGFFELQKLMMDAFSQVSESLKRNFGHIDWHRLKPFSIVYFMEYMESLRTPSWKRRMHGFSPSVTVEEVKELHKALFLANLAYSDSIDEIKMGLKEELNGWELIYAQMKNAPGEPAHYIALRSASSVGFMDRNHLDVLIVIRGTKDFADVLSDGLLDAVDFRGGKAHAGLAKSGNFIVENHRDLLHELLKMSKKQRIKLTLIGHSLGAGAASIAGLIFNEDDPLVDANVVGFGCPALLSKELSESTKNYVTTVVSDSDMIPRLSGPTLENAFFDVMSFDWIEKGLEDLQSGLEVLRTNLPFDIPPEIPSKVYDFIKKILEEHVKPEMDEMARGSKTDVVLMPPGQCIHFYRDGSAITGQKIECSFFDSLEISRTMVDDHLIGVGYNRMLLDYMRAYMSDYQFVFEQKI